MTIQEIAKKLMTRGKGILAADESTKTANKRLEAVGAPATEEMRRAYRALFLETPSIETYLSGVILYTDSLDFIPALQARGIVPGVKVDLGTTPCDDSPNETITNGLSGLDERIRDYAGQGARFTKWRSVVTIGDGLPTDACIARNARDIAKYAREAQEASLVPIIEPEVLLTGDHTLARSEEVLTRTLEHVFGALRTAEVDLHAVILKTSMALPGSGSSEEVTAQDVASATIRALRTAVPIELAGVVFLSGGQTPNDATKHLNAIAKEEPLPWEIAFSYARALQGPALEIWRGKEENVETARKKFIELLEQNTLADQGLL